jgi:hypothetical protein
MNQIGEAIRTDNLVCRQMDIEDLMFLLKHDIYIYWSWGAMDECYNSQKTWFRVSVSGHHHTGYVYIFLNGADLFDVYLTTATDETIINFVKDLYFDELVDWIDEKVEKVPEYS